MAITRYIKQGGSLVPLGGNATVTSTDITPPQAFVLAWERFIASYKLYGTDIVDFSNSDIEGMSQDFIDAAVLLANGFYPNVYGLKFDNNRAGTAVVDLILSRADNFSLVNSAPLFLDGPDMGVPTPEVVGVLPHFTITIEDPATLDFDCYPDSGFELHVQGDAGIPLADSEYIFGYFKIGTQDNPAADQVADKIFELFENWSPVVPSGLTVEGNVLTYQGAVAQSWYLRGTPPSGCTIEKLDATSNPDYSGLTFVKNAAITARLNAGGTVTVSEWVDRIGPDHGGSGAKESVTYSP